MSREDKISRREFLSNALPRGLTGLGLCTSHANFSSPSADILDFIVDLFFDYRRLDTSPQPQVKREPEELGRMKVDRVVSESDLEPKHKGEKMKSEFEVLSIYYPWYDEYRHWDDVAEIDNPFGVYRSRDERIVIKHDDMLVGSGTNVVLFSYWGKDSFEERVVRDCWLEVLRKDGRLNFSFLVEPFGILEPEYIVPGYGRIDLTKESSKRRFLEELTHILVTYSPEEMFYKPDGRCFIGVWGVKTFSRHSARGLKEVIRTVERDLGCELHLAADELELADPLYSNIRKSLRRQLLSDFGSLFCYMPIEFLANLGDEERLRRLDERYEEWGEYANEMGLDLITTPYANFESRKDNFRFSGGPEFFERNLDLCLRHARRWCVTGEPKIIYPFNEYAEASNLDKDVYLEILRKKLLEHSGKDQIQEVVR